MKLNKFIYILIPFLSLGLFAQGRESSQAHDGRINYIQPFETSTSFNSEFYSAGNDGFLIKCNIAASLLDLSGKGIKTIGGCVFRNSTYYGGVDSYGVATSYGYAQAEMIEKLVIPEGVKKNGNSAFDACSITELTFQMTR